MRNQINSTQKVTLLKLLKPHHSVLTTGITTLLHFLISIIFFFLFSFTLFSQEQTFTVTASSGIGFNIDNQLKPTLTLEKGKTYRFDLSSSSLSIYDFAFSTTSDGTHGGGTILTDGVTYVGTPADAGAYVDITIPISTCLLYTSPSPRDRTRSRMPSSA